MKYDLLGPEYGTFNELHASTWSIRTITLYLLKLFTTKSIFIITERSCGAMDNASDYGSEILQVRLLAGSKLYLFFHFFSFSNEYCGLENTVYKSNISKAEFAIIWFPVFVQRD